MRWFSLYRIDFFQHDNPDFTGMCDASHVKELTCDTVEEVLSFRDTGIRDRLLDYINSGKEGALYCDEVCLAHALLWREKNEIRRLFGFLALPRGIDFIFFFKSEAFVTTLALQAFISYFYRENVPIGISSPRYDSILQEAIHRTGFTHTHSLMCVEVLKSKFVFRWPKGW